MLAVFIALTTSPSFSIPSQHSTSNRRASPQHRHTHTSTLHQPPAPLQHQGGESLCRRDINIQCAVKARTTVNTVHMKSWLSLAGAQTLTQRTHTQTQWAQLGQRVKQRCAKIDKSLRDKHSPHTPTQKHTLTHPFPKAVGLRGPAG